VKSIISKIAVGLACTIALSAVGADRGSEQKTGPAGTAKNDTTSQQAVAPVDLPLAFSNVDVTRNIKRRFGAPHVAVNPKNPNNIIVLASMSLGRRPDCRDPGRKLLHRLQCHQLGELGLIAADLYAQWWRRRDQVDRWRPDLEMDVLQPHAG